MDVWLHPGAGKTGTSAIQVALVRHRDALAAAGLVYPVGKNAEIDAKAGRITSGNATAIAALLSPGLRSPGFDGTGVPEWVDACLDAAGARPVLFSSELLDMASEAQLRGFADRLRARGRRVRAVYFVRHALDAEVASYALALKTGRLDRLRHSSLEEHVAAATVRYGTRLDVMEGALGLGNVEVRLYDAAQAGEGVARHLLGVIDPAFAAVLPPDAAPESLNRTPTAIELAVLERLCRVPASLPLAAQLFTQAVLLAPPAVPVPVTVSPDAYAAFAARNAPVVEALNRRWLPPGHEIRLASDRIRIAPPEPLDEALLETVVAVLAGMPAAARYLVRRELIMAGKMAG